MVHCKDDLTGKVFGFLRVEGRAEDRIASNGSRQAAWSCVCRCGRTKVVTNGHLKNSHTRSCGKCGAYDSSIDMTGMRIGMVTVAEKTGTWHTYPDGDRDFYWKCLCDCGNYVVFGGKYLREKGRRNVMCSCGCARRFKRISDDDMVNRRFGRLTVIERADDYVGPDGSHVSQWLCECVCGSIAIVRGASLRNGHTASCGCYRFSMLASGGNSMSKSEIWAHEFLDERHVRHEQQKTFPGLVGVGGHALGYDFYLPDVGLNGLLLECNGLQHYEPVAYFGGEAAFSRQVEHDRRKRDYANDNGIELYEMSVAGKLRDDIRDELSILLGSN